MSIHFGNSKKQQTLAVLTRQLGHRTLHDSQQQLSRLQAK